MLNVRVIIFMIALAAVMSGWAEAVCPPPADYDPTTEEIRSGGDTGELLQVRIATGDTIAVSDTTSFVMRPIEDDVMFDRYQATKCWYHDGWTDLSGTIISFQVGTTPFRQDITLPELYRVKGGESYTTIARELSRKLGRTMTERELQSNNGLNRPYVREGQTIMLGKASCPIWTWSYVEGDASGIEDMLGQIPYFDVSDGVKQLWITQLAATRYTIESLTSTPEQPLFLDGLAYGGKTPGSKFKVVNQLVLCQWYEKGKGVVTTLDARVYPPVVYRGMSYQLLQFERCKNGAYIKAPIQPKVEIQVVAHNEQAAPAESTTKTELPPAQTPVKGIKPPQRAGEWRNKGVAWLTGIYYDQTRDGFSGFTGLETAFRFGNPKLFGLIPEAALMVRVEQSLQGIDVHELKHGGSHGGDYWLGGEFRLWSHGDWYLRPQIGVGYSASQRNFYWDDVSDPRVIVHHVDRWCYDSFWGFGVLNANAPMKTYARAALRGGKFIKDQNYTLTTEPAGVYLRGTWGRQIHNVQARHKDGLTRYWPQDSFESWQTRLGFRPTNGLLLYGFYQSDEYRAKDFWSTDARGEGLGVEIKLSSNFRLLPEFTYYHRFDNTNGGLRKALADENVPLSDPRWKDVETKSNKREYRLALVYFW